MLTTDVSVLVSTSSDIIHTLTGRLGSVEVLMDGTQTIADVTEVKDLVLQYRMYDAFGRPRNTSATSYATNKDSNLLTDWADTKRGFTGHEHLPERELIHMNGRVYDYNVGRFMSVDPVIQFPSNSQSKNPYSYIMNNPLSGTDPTGYTSCGDGAGGSAGNCATNEQKAQQKN
jgi:RHS repeat-associated protein